MPATSYLDMEEGVISLNLLRDAHRLTRAFWNSVFLYNLVPHLERLPRCEHSAARRQPMSKHPDFLLLFPRLVDHLSLGALLHQGPSRCQVTVTSSFSWKLLVCTDHRIPSTPRHSFIHFFLLSEIVPSTCSPESGLNPQHPSRPKQG